MVTWTNLDKLASYQELANAEIVNLAEVMTGENGADRVKKYNVPMGAGLVYNLLKEKNKYLAVFAAAIVCPIVNTGVFLIGCFLFFFKTVEAWGLAMGFENTIEYMFLGLVGGNFLFEMITNIVLCPAIVRVLNLRKKK